jgi:diguanylate cyclase (GGDEF)-like protein
VSGLAITLLVVLGVLALVLGGVLVATLLRRASKEADERIASAVADLNQRMESMVGELGRALERAEADSRRNRLVGDLGGTIDLDDVLERALEAATAVTGADAGLIALAEGFEGEPLTATLGLTVEEAERHGVVAGPPDGRLARSVSFSYRYDEEEVAKDGGLFHAGLAVPLVVEDEPLGHLAVFTRSAGRSFEETEARELEELAVRVAPAVENARRFREARHLADLDALTGLHNRRYFHETLMREASRAQRYHRNLALIVFDLDDFKAINDRIGHLAGDAVLATAAERVREVVRSADVACRVGGDEFGVVLPESTLADADALSRRIQAAVSAHPIGQAGTLSLSAGVAGLRAEDDASTFFQRADDALYRAKEAGKAQVVAAVNNAPA